MESELQEVPLTGGMSTPGVVRVGDTVRRPLKADAGYTQDLLLHLERCGFSGAPRFLGVDERGRTILSYIEGCAPPNNGLRLSETAVRAGATLVRAVHDLTEGTRFAAGAEVASHPNLSQPNFVFRESVPVAIIDWDGTRAGTPVSNLGDFLWAFVHPAVYEDVEVAARMLREAVVAYGCRGDGLVEAMLANVRRFVDEDPEVGEWGVNELAYMERNAGLFESRLSA